MAICPHLGKGKHEIQNGYKDVKFLLLDPGYIPRFIPRLNSSNTSISKSVTT